jgi:transposase
MAFTWQGPPRPEEIVNLGPLALIHPLLERLGVAAVIDQHLPPDPQLEFSHGRVLSLLLAARLARPTALVNIAEWADQAGADLLWNIPADKLNDDRLGRALDAFFDQRHSIMAGVTLNALELAELTLQRLHFDTTHLIFYGAYATSQPRPVSSPDELFRGDDHLEPAHITHGYLSAAKMIQVGVTSVVDELGAVPVLCHCLDGNRNGHTAIREQIDLLQEHLPLPSDLLLVSDRGTVSLEHIARLHRHNRHMLCAVPWNDYRVLYDANADRLNWQQASFLSQEQQRRRATGSALPREHYDLAVLSHTLHDPSTGEDIPCRILFVRSTAAIAEERQRRQQNIATIRSGLDALAAKLQRGHPCTTVASMQRQIARLLGRRGAAEFFHWELLPLTAEEVAQLPPPRKGFRRPTHRLEYTFDEAAATAATGYDGLSILLTTAPLLFSGDELFTKYKEQCYVELTHHQWKTPLLVRPVFLKSPQRVEALVCLLAIALQAYQMLERLYRQNVPEDAPQVLRRTSTQTLLRRFQTCGVVVERTLLGRVAHATRPTSQQTAILNQLGFPSVAETLSLALPPVPTG